jgi:hypothetical protein
MARACGDRCSALSKPASAFVCISTVIRALLVDFELLVHDLARRPTRIADIVPDNPADTGACGAAGKEMGGVYYGSPENMHHFSGRYVVSWDPRCFPR